MKKIVFALLLCMLSLSAFCQSSVSLGGTPIEWQIKKTDNPVKGGGSVHKAPAKLPTPPEATLLENVLNFLDSHAEYTLYIISEDGEEVYEALVPENTSTITLPLNLSGEYELQLVRGEYCFYTNVIL
ncbi:hypothetical protein L6466_11395 [Prevotella communis]|uniref:hypothetical protein n=1 Tax=Prevotella communis TaxID=2913614 RepID=UPI001EDBFF5C|nr:hypothetical protein [Prevotella communis]UKK67945.1 hypothetical protein L6464_01090 [Prevotella communis]UKK69920.1 hypothetical protein L6466_11395 [Prevotella communis]